uniref:Protein translocase subunit SecY n=1 Tax=Candidatus Kentrum sp. MB TaxID=2138164 RepID=A0A450XSI6_9GAMM|nr:MAG: protein translocase subunit secY/sec61 alpha [Candidatus Kentron sp. MB]VFK32232.1 MAG: protein translocase subunit secY/sec61 alpha [Candidatus Kentron sp. MB]VFK75764.1 MAG: protein translocase subunit secY/sec61 alpha [Candidatus Kentron sp. MB]
MVNRKSSIIIAQNSTQEAAAVELKERLLFVLGVIVVFRIGSFVPVPGIDPIALEGLVNEQRGTILDMFNMFSGGALSRFSVFAIGIMPYISSAIIMQLLVVIHPKLEQLKKEGESGRKKITQYTRYGTVLLAVFQALGVAIALEGQEASGSPVVINAGFSFQMTAVITLVAGTIFLMWLGEQINDRGIGNGISLIIFAGIVAGLPSAVGGTLELSRTGELHVLILLFLAVIALGVTAFVVFVERGQRRIAINYAKRQEGRRLYAGQSTHLPFKINMAGVIPPIFASSIILFPATLGRWFGSVEEFSWLSDISILLSPGQPVYTIFYMVAIIFFCFFYTALVFDPRETADNLRKSGAFVPGIRPGDQTARYIDKIMTRLTMIGAVYITLVCLLPEFMIVSWNVPFYFGGTSLLIIVIVVMDLMAQIQTYMASRRYEGMLKRANLKSSI